MKSKQLFILLILILTGCLLVTFVAFDIQEREAEKEKIELQSVHNEAIEKVNNSINNFATLISGVRAYIDNTDSLPNEIALQKYVNSLLEDIDYKDSIIVSFVDKNHTFKYTFTRGQMDPANLKGRNVKEFRDEEEINNLNNIMTDHDLHLFEPINLVEGWPGIPMNFAVYKNDQAIGYIASIINFNYIIEPIYKNKEIIKDFVFGFKVDEGYDFDRFRVYDGTKVYHNDYDPEYYRNFVESEDYVLNSNIIKYGLNLKVSTAYKEQSNELALTVVIIMFWFLTTIILVFVILKQLNNTQQVNLKLDVANHNIKSKNKEIQSEMKVGRDLQGALLPSKEMLKEIFEEYLLIYKPKEIVGGDFYWAYKNRHLKMWCVSDCTGHGVSGALMSMVGNRLLNETIKENNIVQPDKVLNMLRDRVSKGFTDKSTVLSKSGMEMTICVYNSKTNEVSFSGANNPIYLLKNSSQELTHNDEIGRINYFKEGLYEIKGDNFPIGDDFIENPKFNRVKFNVEEGDVIYSLSDGITDQLGGTKNRKFLKKRFKNLLISIKNETIQNQKDLINLQLDEWQGTENQTDDICVLAIRF